MNSKSLYSLITSLGCFSTDGHKLSVALKLFSGADRTKQLEEILAGHVKVGDLHFSRETAELLGRDLSTNELETILAKLVEKGEFAWSIEVAKSLGRELNTNELETILEDSVREGEVEKSVRIAKSLGRELNTNELETILAICIKNGRLVSSRETAKLLGRNLSTDDLIQIARSSLKNGNISDAISSVMYMEISTRDRIRWLSKIIKFCLKKGDIYHASKTAVLLPEPERTCNLERILKIYLKNANVYYALETAKFIGRGLSQEEIWKLFRLCLKKLIMNESGLRDLKTVVMLLDEPKRTMGILNLLTLCLNRKCRYSTVFAIELFPEERRSIILCKFLEQYAKHDEERSCLIAEILLRS